MDGSSRTNRGFTIVEPPVRDGASAMAARFQATMDLFEAAEVMVRQNALRRNPSASEEELEAAVCEWLHDRPGAEFGDADGRPVAWPRPR